MKIVCTYCDVFWNGCLCSSFAAVLHMVCMLLVRGKRLEGVRLEVNLAADCKVCTMKCRRVERLAELIKTLRNAMINRKSFLHSGDSGVSMQVFLWYTDSDRLNVM